MAGATPTARTLERLRKLGCPCQVVERWQRTGPDAGDLVQPLLAQLSQTAPKQSDDEDLVAWYEAAIAGALALLNRHAEKARLGPPGRRIDLWGCIDILVLDGLPGYLGIQACAGSGLAARIAKAREIPELRQHLAAGNRWQCWGWRETWVETSTRTKAKRWKPRRVALELVSGRIEQCELDAIPRPPDAPAEVAREQWVEGGPEGNQP